MKRFIAAASVVLLLAVTSVADAGGGFIRNRGFGFRSSGHCGVGVSSFGRGAFIRASDCGHHVSNFVDGRVRRSRFFSVALPFIPTVRVQSFAEVDVLDDCSCGTEALIRTRAVPFIRGRFIRRSFCH